MMSLTAICGVFGTEDKNLVKRMLGRMKGRGRKWKIITDDGICFGVMGDDKPLISESQGKIYILDGYFHREDMAKPSKQIDLWKDGVFSFACWDGNNLTLARDALGIKQLFYTIVDGKVLLFASEIKPLLEYPDLKIGVNPHSFAQLYCLGYVRSTTTFIKNILQIQPSTLHKFYIRGENLCSTQTSLWKNISSKQMEEKAAISKIQKALRKILSDYSAGRDKVGLWLSGGLDSTCILRFAGEFFDEIYTFTISDDPGHPDVKAARKVSAHCGTIHEEIIINFEDFWKRLPEFTHVLETPRRGAPTYLISEVARKKVRYVLSSEGGDEIFGYAFYGNLSELEEKALTRLQNLNPPEEEAKQLKEYLRSLFNHKGPAKNTFDNFLNLYLRDGVLSMHLQFHDKGSRGVEMLFPFLDIRFLKVGLEIPMELKLKEGTCKYILRKASDLQSGKLRFVLKRKKYTLSSNLININSKIAYMADKLITDKYFEAHPFRRYFMNKDQVLMFDLFYYIFIEHRGKLPKKFSIEDMY